MYFWSFGMLTWMESLFIGKSKSFFIENFLDRVFFEKKPYEKANFFQILSYIYGIRTILSGPPKQGQVREKLGICFFSMKTLILPRDQSIRILRGCIVKIDVVLAILTHAPSSGNKNLISFLEHSH